MPGENKAQGKAIAPFQILFQPKPLIFTFGVQARLYPSCKGILLSVA